MSVLKQALTIAAKDLRTEMRTKETLNATLAFALTILLLFSFAFDPTAEMTREIAGGLLWLVFAFAAALILNRAFARDQPNECLELLLASPLHPTALFAGKALASGVLLLAVEVVCLPVFGLFYNISWGPQLRLLPAVMLLATWGLAVVGAAFSALTVNLRLRELMLPMLLYPVMIPSLLAAIQLTTAIANGSPLDASAQVWFRLLVGFDMIYTLLAIALIEPVLIG